LWTGYVVVDEDATWKHEGLVFERWFGTAGMQAPWGRYKS